MVFDLLAARALELDQIVLAHSFLVNDPSSAGFYAQSLQ
jgi:hypothetical protein